MHTCTMGKVLVSILAGLAAAVVSFTLCSCDSSVEPPREHAFTAQDIVDVAGICGDAELRVVWVNVTDSVLRTYDSENCRFSTLASRTVDEMAWPVLTPDGNSILFASTNRIIYSLAWNDTIGASLARLKDGFCPVGVWTDRVRDQAWVYYLKNTTRHLYRFRLDQPSYEEAVWDSTAGDHPFSLSYDGKYGAGQWPWPHCGLITQEYSTDGRAQPNGDALTVTTPGCNSNVLPDNSYLLFHVNKGTVEWDGKSYPNHGGLYVYPDLVHGIIDPAAFIPLQTRGKQFHRARISNHPRIFTFFGPAPFVYDESRDIYLGRFNSSYTGMTDTLNLTAADSVDNATPYAWVSNDSSALYSSPPLNLLSPVAGEEYIVGDTMHIRWRANTETMSGVVIRFSNNAGEDWVSLVNEGAVTRDSPEWEDYGWVIPDEFSVPSTGRNVKTTSEACIVEIMDYNAPSISAGTGECFRICDAMTSTE